MAKQKKVEALTNKELEAKLSYYSTVSGKIRYLDSIGYSRAEIARKLNKRYQHVRNVLTGPTPKAK